MDIIRVPAKRGLELKGAIFGGGSMESVVIMISGICSNVFQNDLLTASGNLLMKNGIAFIAGHTTDAFSCMGYSDLIAGKQIYTGTVFSDFNIIYEDVDAYIKYAKDLGFKDIILAGHSLGSNKIIHYLGNTSEETVNYFIVTAPVDLAHWFRVMPDAEQCLEEAKDMIAKDRGKDILPRLFGGFSPMTAESVLNLYNASNLKNCPVISNEGETKSLADIKVNGHFVIGEKDSLVNDNPKGFLQAINSHCKNPAGNGITVIPDASHIFYGKHEEYAQAILDIVSGRKS